MLCCTLFSNSVEEGSSLEAWEADTDTAHTEQEVGAVDIRWDTAVDIHTTVLRILEEGARK